MTVDRRITLYHSPNTRSSGALTLLEELGAPYELHVLNMKAGEQRQPAYLSAPLSTKDSNRGFDGDAANAGSPEFSPDCGAKDLRQLQRRRHP